jgi:dTDP-4-dehydrorhamnose reductase
MRIGIIGANGFVGTELFKSLTRKGNYSLVPITRETELSGLRNSLDLVVHAGNPAKRFRANDQPEIDYIDTVIKTRNLLNIFHKQKFILISTISCRTQILTPYGKNRRLCEESALSRNGSVLRLGPMFGGIRKQDTLSDIVNNKVVYVAGDSKYAYVNIEWVANYFVENFLSLEGTVEIGAHNTITLFEIANKISSSSLFLGERDDQYPINFTYGPDSNDVLDFAKKLKSTI